MLTARCCWRRQDPAAKITSVKAAQKFFSEDKDRSFEAKVYIALATPRLTYVPLPPSNVSRFV